VDASSPYYSDWIQYTRIYYSFCIHVCGIIAVDGRAKKKTKVTKVNGTHWNFQSNNEVSMMSLDEMPNPKSYTPPSKGTRKQRKRAGIINYGNKRKATEMKKMPRLEGHRKRVHWEVKQA
jgi:hypothetical protein